MATIELFMWAYQQFFLISAKVAAEQIFNALDRDLKPSLFLVGVLTEEREDRHPICLEPENCGYDLEIFSHVKEQAPHYEAIDPNRNVYHSHPRMQEAHIKRLKIAALRSAISSAVKQYDDDRNVVSFCSWPILVEGYMVTIVLQLDREVYNSYYSLMRDHIDTRTEVETSLLSAAIKEYLEGCSDALTKPEPGNGLNIIGRDADEIIRAAGRRLMYTPGWAAGELEGLHSLFHACNTISSMRYEGAEGIGRMLIAKPNHPNIEVMLPLSTRIRMNDHRAVRKLLEISSNDTCLLTDAASIYGIGKMVNLYDQRREDLFEIHFTKHYTWELWHAGHNLMRVSYGQPQLPRLLIDRDKFSSTVRRVFVGATPKQIEKLWALVSAATEQRHGTMVVVSSSAKEEADRLRKQSIKIEPTIMTQELIGLVTSIDGAVLMDSNAICYAIGVILDGIASQKGSSSRGARFNSAIRYIEGRNESLAIVISVDGSIDLIPDLKPQIRRSDILKAIEKLSLMSTSSNINFEEFNNTMDWLSEHEFYLGLEVCREINLLRNQIEGGFPEDIKLRIVYRDFEPNAEMNESYFLDK